MDTVSLSIVISALNESEIILKNIDELSDWLNSHMTDITYEIVIVDDGSTDGMYAILQNAASSRPWLKVFQHKKNLGRGRGIRTGFQYSVGKYIICLDADLSYGPEHISKLLLPLMNNEADITLASPYHPKGAVSNVPKQRAVLSKWGNRLLSRGLGMNLSTVTCVVRGFNRTILKDLELVSNGKELHLEIIQKAKLMNYRILEIPAALVWRDKKRGKQNNRKFLPEIAIFKMRKTVLSHLIYNYISNPGLLLSLPILALITVIISGFASIVYEFINKLLTLNLSVFQTIRETMIQGRLSLLIVIFSVIILMVFVAFYFISFQLKYYFEELYILSTRINSRLKDLEQLSE